MALLATHIGIDVVGVCCVGLTLVTLLVPASGGGATSVRAARLLVPAAGAWLVLVLVAVVLRAADAAGRPVAGLGVVELATWAAKLSAGRGMVLTAGCVVLVFGCALGALRRPDRVPARVPLFAALLALITSAVTGHVSTDPGRIAVLALAVHVVASALWVGGLAALACLIARDPAQLAAALPPFSRLAAACLAAVAVTGVVTAMTRLPSWGALLTTGYGGLVVAKVLCLGVVGGLGGLARHRLLTHRTPVLRWAGYELAAMAVALGLAATLAQTPG
jgi:putative copper resistance protein D